MPLKSVDIFENMLNFEFVCLFNQSLHAETHLGPDGTRLKQNAQARVKVHFLLKGSVK